MHTYVHVHLVNYNFLPCCKKVVKNLSFVLKTNFTLFRYFFFKRNILYNFLNNIWITVRTFNIVKINVAEVAGLRGCFQDFGTLLMIHTVSNHTHFHNHTWQLKNGFLHDFFTSSILIWGGTHLFGTVNRSLDKILTSVFCFRVKNNGTSYFIFFEKEAYLVCVCSSFTWNIWLGNTASLIMDRINLVQ